MEPTISLLKYSLRIIPHISLVSINVARLYGDIIFPDLLESVEKALFILKHLSYPYPAHSKKHKIRSQILKEKRKVFGFIFRITFFLFLFLCVFFKQYLFLFYYNRLYVQSSLRDSKHIHGNTKEMK